MAHSFRGDVEVIGTHYLGVYTTAERTASSPSSEGAMLWDSTLNKPYWWDGSAWDTLPLATIGITAASFGTPRAFAFTDGDGGTTNWSDTIPTLTQAAGTGIMSFAGGHGLSTTTIIRSTDTNQAITIGSDGGCFADARIFTFADRATAAAATWTNVTYPAMMHITADDAGSGIATGLPTLSVLTAAPTDPITVASELTFGRVHLDSNAEWGDEISPFPAGTHGTSNVLARQAHNAQRANSGAGSNADGTSDQLWLPPLQVLGTVRLTAAQINAGGAMVPNLRAWSRGLVIGMRVQQVGSTSVTGTLTFDFDYSTAANAFASSTIALSGTAASQEFWGLSNFSTGFGGNPGLMRENDNLIINVTLSGGGNTTNDFQVVVLGYNLTPTPSRA